MYPLKPKTHKAVEEFVIYYCEFFKDRFLNMQLLIIIDNSELLEIDIAEVTLLL